MVKEARMKKRLWIAISLLVLLWATAAHPETYLGGQVQGGGIPACTDAEYTAGVKTDCAGTPANAKVELDKKAAVNASTTGSAGSLKSPATTGLLTVTGVTAGQTRNWTVPDADVTIPATPIGLSGAMTDEQLLCGENTDGTTKAKSCGAKTTDNSTNDHILAKISGAVENATIVKTIYLPVAYFEDGAAPPAAASVLASTRKVKIRAFDGASNENLEVSFTVPVDYSSGIKFRFIGYVPGATAPANTEVVAFSFAGCSVANSEVLGCTAGDPQTSSLTADANYVQYDRIAGAWSSAITVTGIAAGETVQGILIRLAESTDTYAQDFALAGIEIKYVATFIMGGAY